MTTVVTGASGHLGGVLVRALLARGERVRAVCHSDQRAVAGTAAEVVRGDVCDPASMRAALDGATVLYHFAAIVSIAGDPTGAVWRTNVDGVRVVMAAARDAGVRRVVHCSSLHAFDATAARCEVDETCPRAVSPREALYARSKNAGEAEVQRAIAQGLDAVIVNPTGVIGPSDYKPGRMGQLFLSLARRRVPALVPGGMDWVDVRDVARAAIAAADRGERGQNYLLGGHWAPVAEVARLAAGVTGVPAPRVVTPFAVAAVGAPFAELFARVTRREPLYTRESLAVLRDGRRVSSARAARVLDHAPRPLEDTIADVYRWFRAEGRLGPTAKLP